MRKSISLSAILSSLLATPLLAAPPVRQQDFVPIVQVAGSCEVLPGEAELQDQLEVLMDGRPLDAHGMQRLQGQMALATHDHLNRVMMLQRELVGYPELFPIQAAPAGAVQVRHMEKAAFLGIATSPATPILQEQLGIPHGMGLVVDYIEKDSPADAAGLKVHDILQKLDDQVLINPQQLAVLVRAKKPGEKLMLTIIRGGKSETLSATLAEKELPVLEELQEPNFMTNPGGIPLRQFDMQNPGVADDGVIGPHATTVSIHVDSDGSQVRTYVDDQHDISLTNKPDGTSNLVVKDRAGHVIYEGPEKADLPPEIKAKVESLKQKANITVHTGNAAAPGNTDAVSLSRTDEDYQLTLHTDNHGRLLTVKDAKTGKVLFDGPENSDKDLASLPPAALEKVKALDAKAKMLQDGMKNGVGQ